VRTRQHGDGLTEVVATEAPPLEGDSLYTTMCVISRYRGARGIGSVLHHFHVYWRHIDIRACTGIESSSPARARPPGVTSTYAHVRGLKDVVVARYTERRSGVDVTSTYAHVRGFLCRTRHASRRLRHGGGHCGHPGRDVDQYLLYRTSQRHVPRRARTPNLARPTPGPRSGLADQRDVAGPARPTTFAGPMRASVSLAAEDASGRSAPRLWPPA